MTVPIWKLNAAPGTGQATYAYQPLTLDRAMMQIGSSGVSRIGTCQHEMMPAALCICLPLVYLLPTFCLRFPHRGSVGARPLDRDLGYRPTPPSWPNLRLPRATGASSVTLWLAALPACPITPQICICGDENRTLISE